MPHEGLWQQHSTKEGGTKGPHCPHTDQGFLWPFSQNELSEGRKAGQS